VTIFQVIVPSTFLKKSFEKKFPIDNEVLFGEKVRVINEFKSWYFCETLIDKYKGWVTKKDLSANIMETTYRVIKLRSHIYKSPNEKSHIFNYLPLGSKIMVIDHDRFWAKISFEHKKKTLIGYIPFKHIVKKNHKVNDWVNIAEQFLNVPYRWGGRDSIGVDCSALIQLSLETYGINFPRDTELQILENYKKIEINNLHRGAIVFWDGHVGVMTDKKNFLHSNAFHMQTIIEPFKDVCKRSEIINQNIKAIISIL